MPRFELSKLGVGCLSAGDVEGAPQFDGVFYLIGAPSRVAAGSPHREGVLRLGSRINEHQRLAQWGSHGGRHSRFTRGGLGEQRRGNLLRETGFRQHLGLERRVARESYFDALRYRW